MEDDTKNELFAEAEEAPVAAEPAPNSLGARSILSDKEIAEAKKVARDRLEKAMKEAEKDRLVAEEMERLRREEGKRTGNPDRDELVRVTIDVAEYADRLVINGFEYHNGYSYDVPRHVYESMRETMYRTHLLQRELDDKDLTQFYRDRSRFRANDGPVLTGRGQ